VVGAGAGGCAGLGLFDRHLGGALPAGPVASSWTAPALVPYGSRTPRPSASQTASRTPLHQPTRQPTKQSTKPTTARTSASPSHQPTLRWPAVQATRRPTSQPTATKRPSPSPSPTRTTAPPSSTPTSSGSYTVRTDWANAVLAKLNSERAAHGLAALRMNSHLVSSAHTHNLAMAKANQLSHQLSGEASLGSRITAAGYRWSAVGENIAYNSQRTQAGVLALQDMMYGEQPPNDGHRQNILSTSYVDVGVDVIDDAVHHRVWLVTDFGRP
jgi:uncharacterized protein YkwD